MSAKITPRSQWTTQLDLSTYYGATRSTSRADAERRARRRRAAARPSAVRQLPRSRGRPRPTSPGVSASRSTARARSSGEGRSERRCRSCPTTGPTSARRSSRATSITIARAAPTFRSTATARSPTGRTVDGAQLRVLRSRTAGPERLVAPRSTISRSRAASEHRTRSCRNSRWSRRSRRRRKPVSAHADPPASPSCSTATTARRPR